MSLIGEREGVCQSDDEVRGRRGCQKSEKINNVCILKMGPFIKYSTNLCATYVRVTYEKLWYVKSHGFSSYLSNSQSKEEEVWGGVFE